MSLPESADSVAALRAELARTNERLDTTSERLSSREAFLLRNYEQTAQLEHRVTCLEGGLEHLQSWQAAVSSPDGTAIKLYYDEERTATALFEDSSRQHQYARDRAEDIEYRVSDVEYKLEEMQQHALAGAASVVSYSTADRLDGLDRMSERLNQRVIPLESTIMQLERYAAATDRSSRGQPGPPSLHGLGECRAGRAFRRVPRALGQYGTCVQLMLDAELSHAGISNALHAMHDELAAARSASGASASLSSL